MKVEEVQVENASGYRGKQLDVPSVVATIEFRELKLRYGTGEQWQNIVESFGVVYVTSITRDGCSGCIEQKPLFRELASRMVKDTPDIVRFSNIHIRYSEADSSESPEAKKALRHGAYPTYTIYVKSRFGPLELYRAIYPTMEELEKQVNEAFSLAEYYKADAEALVKS
jgi:thiol-disulfide isomerase/thioredoxin